MFCVAFVAVFGHSGPDTADPFSVCTNSARGTNIQNNGENAQFWLILELMDPEGRIFHLFVYSQFFFSDITPAANQAWQDPRPLHYTPISVLFGKSGVRLTPLSAKR